MAFIVFEGLDGSGKSTLIQALDQELRRRGLVSRVTREPGGTHLGEEVREVLLRTDQEAPVPRAELFLYAAGRAQHVDLVIRPALEQGEWVLCDRFYASTAAFQCGGRGLERSSVDLLNSFAVDGCWPDLTVLLDVSVEESLRRRQQRELKSGVAADRFEREKRVFHQRVRDFYLQLAKEASSDSSSTPSGPWLKLDAERLQAEDLLALLIGELEERKWLNSSSK